MKERERGRGSEKGKSEEESQEASRMEQTLVFSCDSSEVSLALFRASSSFSQKMYKPKAREEPGN